MKLRDVTRHTRGNRYCGPAAMSAVLGIDTDQAAATLREVTGRRSIKGTCRWEVAEALKRHGVKMTTAPTYYQPYGRETVQAWAKRTHAKRGDKIYLVQAGHHWRVHQGWNQVCGITRQVTTVAHAHKPRSLVVWVYELDASQAKSYEPRPKASRRDPTRRLSYKARKMLKALDLELDIDHHSGMAPYWVSPGKSWTKDPRADEHFADDWAGVLELAEYYAEHAHLRLDAKTDPALALWN